MGLRDDFGRIQHLRGRFVRNDPARVEHHCPWRVLQHQVHIMGNQNHRDALTVQLPQEFHNLCVVFQILTGSRLIQQDHFRLQNQNGSDGHTLFLSVAESGNGPLAEGVQAADFQGFLHPGANLLFRYAPVAQSQRHLVKNLGLGDHLVGVLHDIADMVGPFLDGQGIQIDAV